MLVTGDGAAGIPDGAEEQLWAAPDHRAQRRHGQLEGGAGAVAAQRQVRFVTRFAAVKTGHQTRLHKARQQCRSACVYGEEMVENRGTALCSL